MIRIMFVRITRLVVTMAIMITMCTAIVHIVMSVIMATCITITEVTSCVCSIANTCIRSSSMMVMSAFIKNTKMLIQSRMNTIVMTICTFSADGMSRVIMLRARTSTRCTMIIDIRMVIMVVVAVVVDFSIRIISVTIARMITITGMITSINTCTMATMYTCVAASESYKYVR